LFLSEPAQGLCTPEGNIPRHVLASGVGRPGVEGPFALHIMSARQPVRSQVFLTGVNPNYVGPSMRVQAAKARSANGLGKSEGRIVPAQPLVPVGETKRGNARGGKAAKPVRRSNRALPGLSAGLQVPTWAVDSARKCVSAGGEPDALTAHVRFWEGAVPN
jgi:hypothetical protein